MVIKYKEEKWDVVVERKRRDNMIEKTERFIYSHIRIYEYDRII